MDRREFLCASAGVAGALAATPAAAETRPELRSALIGCGRRGMTLATTALRAGGCRITAAWDGNPALAAVAGARLGATAYTSLDTLLADAAPELAIVTGGANVRDLSALLQSGAHLFLAMIPGMSAADGAALGLAPSGKVVQVSLDGPGVTGDSEAANLLRSLGHVTVLLGHAHHYYPAAPRVGRQAVIGWAGDILAWSGERSPRRVTATGSEDDQVITWEFAGLTAIWEQRCFRSDAEERVSTGAAYYASTGVLRVDEVSWSFQRHGDPRLKRGAVSPLRRDAAGWAEFLRAIRERRQPASSLDAAFAAIDMVRLAECSRRLERPLEWDGPRRVVVRDAEANRLLRAAPEWLA